MTDATKLGQRVDKLALALLLLTSSLRANIKVEGGEVVASIPVEVLDTIESIIKNL